MIQKPRICKHCGHSEWGVTAHVTQDWIIDECGEFLECTQECVEVTHEPDEDDVWTCANCGAEYDPGTSPDDISDDAANDIAHVLYRRYQLDWMLSHNLSLANLFRELQSVYDEYKTENTDLDLEDEFENAGFGCGSIWVCFDEFMGAEFMDPDYMRHLCKDDAQWIAYLQVLTKRMRAS